MCLNFSLLNTVDACCTTTAKFRVLGFEAVSSMSMDDAQLSSRILGGRLVDEGCARAAGRRGKVSKLKISISLLSTTYSWLVIVSAHAAHSTSRDMHSWSA